MLSSVNRGRSPRGPRFAAGLCGTFMPSSRCAVFGTSLRLRLILTSTTHTLSNRQTVGILPTNIYVEKIDSLQGGKASDLLSLDGGGLRWG